MAAREAKPFLLVAAVAMAITLPGCGSTATDGSPSKTGQGVARLERALAAKERADYFERVRTAVVNGARRDFAQGTGIGGPAYATCVRGLLREALDRVTITRLVQVYRRPGGQQFAAQGLNALASPLGAKCGHRYYVPELVEASRGLREGDLTGAAGGKLGVTYGPYLGVRCGRSNRRRCDSVGIDVVFGHAAVGVVAVIGGRRLRLRTPGLHNGVRYRDWVGTFSEVGLERPGSPFYLWKGIRPRRFWAGNPAVYLPVGLQVRFASGRRADAILPKVFLSPGWG